nr:uncharacterized protein LOC111507415 [Leptinotarsa decemlineata]
MKYRREKARVKKSLGSGKGTDDIYKSKWFVFEALKFLNENEPRKTTDSLATASEGNEIEEEESDDLDNTQSENISELESTPVIDTGTTHQNTPKKGFKSPKKCVIKRRKVAENPMVSEAYGYLKKVASTSAFTPVSDDCVVFGSHVGNAIRNFDARLRSIARHKINNILFQLEQTQYDQPTIFPPQPTVVFPQQPVQTTQHRVMTQPVAQLTLLQSNPQIFTQPHFTPYSSFIGRTISPVNTFSSSSQLSPVTYDSQTSISRSSTPHSMPQSDLPVYFSSYNAEIDGDQTLLS